MISTREALQIVQENAFVPTISNVVLLESLGRILAEDLCADRDFPPFDRVTMDGIAICYDQLETGQISFEIEATAAAGNAQKTLQNASNCIEVMTGAIIPLNTDTVIRYEENQSHYFLFPSGVKLLRLRPRAANGPHRSHSARCFFSRSSLAASRCTRRRGGY